MTVKRYSHNGVVIIDHLKEDLIYIDGKDELLELAEYVDKLQQENEELKQSNERLLKMLDNVANYMQRQNKYMPIDDFAEWWNGIATKGLDDGDVE